MTTRISQIASTLARLAPKNSRSRVGVASVLVFSASLATSLSAATLELDREVYSPGQTVTVTYAADGLASDAWAGVVPADVPHGSEAENDLHDLAYQFLDGAASGTVTFEAPGAPGHYDIRLHDSDSDGKEVASTTFEVKRVDATGAALELGKTEFIPGEKIPVHFTTPAGLPRNAWVGIVPSDIPHGSEAQNDANDVDFRYLEEKAEGTLEFNAPVNAGRYDFRMHDTDADGREIATVSFTIVEHVGAEQIAEQLASRGHVALYGIRFDSGKASLDGESTVTLDEIAKLLRADASLELRIEGHTDDQGEEAFNQALSEERAEAVRRYLVESSGIAAERLTTAGFGESRPMASNDTPSGRAQNRRVELARL